MDIDDIHEVLEKLYEERQVFFAVSDITKKLEEGEGTTKNSSQVSSRLKTYELSDKFDKPEITEFTKAGNNRIYAFVDRISLSFPYFNKELQVDEIQDVIDYFRQDIENIIKKRLNDADVKPTDEFSLEVNRDGEVEVKIMQKKKLK